MGLALPQASGQDQKGMGGACGPRGQQQQHPNPAVTRCFAIPTAPQSLSPQLPPAPSLIRPLLASLPWSREAAMGKGKGRQGC